MPGAPTNVNLEVVSSTQLRLSWDTPSEKNGIISDYYIKWRIVRNDTDHIVHGPLLTARKAETENRKMIDIEDLGKHYNYFIAIFERIITQE